MSKVSDRIAYLKGLKDGMRLTDENLNKLLGGIIEVLDAVSDRLDDTDDYIDEIAEAVDDLCDDVDDIDEVLDEILDECECDGDCDCCDDLDDEFDARYDACCCGDDDDCLDVECPHCHEPICFDADLFTSGEELRCPICDKVVFPEEE